MLDKKIFATLFKLLVEKKEQNAVFRFIPRTTDRYQRLSNGYLLNGTSYISVGLVCSGCSLSKIFSVQFFWDDTNCGVSFIWRTGDDENIKKLIEKVRNSIADGSLKEFKKNDECWYYALYFEHSMEDAVDKLVDFCIQTLYPAINDLQLGYLLEFPDKIERIINEGKNRVNGILNEIKEDVVEDVHEEENLDNIASESPKDLNVILYGPPGTGKTYNTVFHAVAICEDKSVKEVENEGFEKVKPRYDSYVESGRIAFTTFHQSYGYEEFIEGIKPVIENNVPGLKYKIEDGVFKKFCKTGETNRKVFIIDEINRGNISKIFGELITLIEDSKRVDDNNLEKLKITLPYSGESFGVPQNIYILGTMNTADRSIALMDTALRRRFKFIEMMPCENLVDFDVVHQGKSVNIKKILEKINERIEFFYDREHTIGHAFFMPLTKTDEYEKFDKLAEIFENKIIPLLQEYFYEDYEKIRLVLGDNTKDNANQFIECVEKNVKGVFGISDDVDNMPEIKKVYTVNKKAFENIDSYIGIYENNRQN